MNIADFENSQISQNVKTFRFWEENFGNPMYLFDALRIYTFIYTLIRRLKILFRTVCTIYSSILKLNL